MSQVPAVPALLGAAIPGRRGESVEAVLVMALLAASAITLGRVQRVSTSPDKKKAPGLPRLLPYHQEWALLVSNQ